MSEETQLLLASDDDQAMAAQIITWGEAAYRYCYDSGTWMWAGPDRWEVFPGDPADTIVATVADKIPKGTRPAKETKPEDMNRDELDYMLHARLANARTAAGIARKIRALAPSSAGAVALRDLDTDGSVLWAGGQPWNLPASGRGLVVATGTDPVHLMSARYSPAVGPTPLWDALLEAAFPDKELRLWAEWEMCGACTASGGKALVHLIGPRDTAKTTALRCYADVLGSYSVQIPRALLSGQQSHEGTVLQLLGARLAWFDEKPRRGQVAQEFLKDLTGGGSFRARPPHGRGAVEGRFTATVVLASNDELPLTDPALLGRVRRVPMTGDPKETRAARAAIIGPDGNFTPAWRAEAPAVLARMILWCAARMNGWEIEMPDVAALELMSAAAEQDSAALFMDTALEAVEADHGSLAGELHAGYVNWCRDHSVANADVLGLVPFGKRLTAVYGAAKRIRRGSAYPCRVRPL